MYRLCESSRGLVLSAETANHGRATMADNAFPQAAEPIMTHEYHPVSELTTIMTEPFASTQQRFLQPPPRLVSTTLLFSPLTTKGRNDDNDSSKNNHNVVENGTGIAAPRSLSFPATSSRNHSVDQIPPLSLASCRESKDNTTPSAPHNDKKQRLAQAVAVMMQARSQSATGRLPKGFVDTLCRELQVTRTDVYNEFRNVDKRVNHHTRTQQQQSSLLLSSMAVDNINEESLVTDTSLDAAAAMHRMESKTPTSMPKKRKRTTPLSPNQLEQQRRLAALKADAMAWIAQELLDQRNALASASNKRPKLPAGAMALAIAKARAKFDLPDDVELNHVTIYDRLAKKTPKPNVHGKVSPMAAWEPLLVQCCLARQRLADPLNSTSFLALVHDLVGRSDSKVEGETTIKPPVETLTKRYYQGFLKRHSHVLCNTLGGGCENQTHDAVSDKRLGLSGPGRYANWTNPYATLDHMYKRVYSAMVDARMARRVDRNGDEDDKPTQYELLDDSSMLFVEDIGDTVGANNLWTLLGITAADGKPVMCCVVLLGYNAALSNSTLSTILDASMTSNEHCGCLLVFPGGPICEFRGKRVPCYVTTTRHSCITGDILGNCLRRLDDLEINERSSDKPSPMVIVEGNFGEFGASFLQYINDKEHEWIVCAGLPFTTCRFWKQGDPRRKSRPTARVKLAGQVAAEKLGELKRRAHDRMPCRLGSCSTYSKLLANVADAWSSTFANTESNVETAAARGWIVLNSYLVSDPRILATKQEL